MDWIDIKKCTLPLFSKIWGMDKNGNAILGYIDIKDVLLLIDENGKELIYPLNKWATYDVIY